MKNVFIQSFVTNKWLQLESDSTSLSYDEIAEQFCRWHRICCPQLKIHHGVREIRNGEAIADVSGDVFLTTSIPALGGKGGFGSMLRALGAQIEKTTNREACRDLSGRRLRDINEEKRLKNWIEKQAEREKEAEERKQRKLEKLKIEYKHEFSDPDYDRARSEVTEKVHDAIVHGIQVAGTSSEPPAAKKPKLETTALKSTLWTGLSDEDLSSSDSEGESNGGANETTIVPEEKSTEHGAVQLQIKETVETNVETELVFDGTPAASGSAAREGTEDATEKASSHNTDNNHPTAECTKKAVDDFSSEPPIDLQSCESAESLESLGLERLKYELQSRGLKCGGTLKERASRLFSIRNLKPEEIDSSLLSKPTKQKK